jgi:hypothetical protein
MFALLFDLEDYATTYRATRDAYLKAANEPATGPYKTARDAYFAATATYTNYEKMCRWCCLIYPNRTKNTKIPKTTPTMTKRTHDLARPPRPTTTTTAT